MRTRVIVALLALAPIVIGATEPVRLQASAPWAIDYAENSCRLVRTFGQGNDQTKLVLESIAPNDMSMMIVGNPVRADLSPFGDTQIYARFIPGQDNWFYGSAARADQGGQPAALWSHVPLMPIPKITAVRIVSVTASPGKAATRPPAIDLVKRAAQRAEQQAFAANVVELEIQTREGHAVYLETGSLGDPLKVFDQCMRDLISTWGVDPDIQDKIVRPAWTPNIRSWFSSANYPEFALREGKESQVTFRLLVDATGTVTKCESFSPYNAPEFNAAVCKALKQGPRFQPAELADGTKVAGYYTDHVVFRVAP